MFVFCLLHQIPHYLRRRKDRAAWRREVDAEELLRLEGYQLLGRREPISRALIIDGRPHHYRLFARYIVGREGKRYVAAVGSVSRFALTREKRRQLLETFLSLECDGALLVDAAKREVAEIDFNLERASAPVALAA